MAEDALWTRVDQSCGVADYSQRRPGCERGWCVQTRVKGKGSPGVDCPASARLPRTVGDWMHSTSLSLSIPRVPSRPSSTASNRSTPSIRARSPSLLPDDTGNPSLSLDCPTEFNALPLSSKNSLYSPSYVHIEAQHSPSTSPAAKSRESASTYPSYAHVSQHFQFSPSLTSTRHVRPRPNNPKWQGQAAFQFRHSP